MSIDNHSTLTIKLQDNHHPDRSLTRLNEIFKLYLNGNLPRTTINYEQNTIELNLSYQGIPYSHKTILWKAFLRKLIQLESTASIEVVDDFSQDFYYCPESTVTITTLINQESEVDSKVDEHLHKAMNLDETKAEQQ